MDGMETKPRIHGTYVICVCVIVRWFYCLPDRKAPHKTGVPVPVPTDTIWPIQLLWPCDPRLPRWHVVLCRWQDVFLLSCSAPCNCWGWGKETHRSERDHTFFLLLLSPALFFVRAFNNFFPDRCFSIPQGSDVRSTAGIELAISEHDISGPLSFLRDKNKEMSKFTTSTKKSSSKCHPGDTARHLINCLLDSFGHNH